MMNVVVAAFDDATRSQLRARIAEAGLEAASAADSDEALGQLLSRGHEQVIVAGTRWPEVEPFLRPATQRHAPLALLLEDADIQASHPAFQRGAAAVLPVSVPARAFALALESILEGLLVLPRPEARPADETRSSSPPAPSHVLSGRERDILSLVASGLPTKQIARRLSLSPNTIKHHLASAFAKLGAGTRARAVSEALRRGELTL